MGIQSPFAMELSLHPFASSKRSYILEQPDGQVVLRLDLDKHQPIMRATFAYGNRQWQIARRGFTTRYDLICLDPTRTNTGWLMGQFQPKFGGSGRFELTGYTFNWHHPLFHAHWEWQDQVGAPMMTFDADGKGYRVRTEPRWHQYQDLYLLAAMGGYQIVRPDFTTFS